MRVFVDANIILDKYDSNRPFAQFSVLCYEYLIGNAQIFTSCDLMTTIYYINAKENKNQALLNIQAINKTLKVIEFSNQEVEDTCKLMIEDSDYTDLEDTIQYIMAKKYNCEIILSNDKNFVAKGIKVMSSEEFCKEYIK